MTTTTTHPTTTTHTATAPDGAVAATTAAGTAQPLLRPADFGDFQLPNRVVMAPTTRARAAGPGLVPTDLHAVHYGQRAGAGLIVAEGTWVSERAIGFVHVPGIYHEAQIAGWRQVTDVVHALGGRIVLQLWHTGAASHPAHLGGALPGGPSAVNPHERSFTATGFQDTVTPREMSRAEIATTVADFRTAAENARRAGFDGVEIGALGSFLIAQFLNPRLNLRTDAYGTDRAGRRRLLLEIIDAVAEPWDGRRVGVRLSPYWTSGDTFTADAETLAAYDELVAELNDRPVAYLHLRGPETAGAGGTPDFAAFARYRRRFDGPFIANLGFDRDSGNALVEEGGADAVSYARHFIANPDLVTRFALDRELAAGDPSTYYTGDARGYVDYPVSA
ncbi:alkene reductase [Streptomyces nigrescens]|uniref:Alkene reductase n=2 Tax=Streptomyces TaxID=1883 RepID=A0ABM7ZYZ3_STRNI|nr:alkene reductase [Streptomyces nigrescens]MEE4422024.1 alkene reductase [Streptomyces sp. DSM 41528]BDM71596.1 alkene reductase [Streptomyces nigrescens]